MDHFRDAHRSLRAAPLVAAMAILSLALGIGATAAIFSILNGLLLKPLPVRDPHQLVSLALSGEAADGNPISYPVWKEVRDRQLLGRAFAWASDRVNISSTAQAQPADVVWASGNIFDVLGLDAALGRTFDSTDDQRDALSGGPVAVISHRYWQRRFGRSADAIGQRVTIERVPFTIVGVLPPDFLGLNIGTTFELILPLETEPLLRRVPERLESPSWRWLLVMARLAPGRDLAGLTSAVRVAQPQIRETTMPAFSRAEDRDDYLRARWEVRSAPGGVSRIRRQYASALFVLLGVVSVVLLIAGANVATLLLGRATARRQEFAVRLSLGATRSRLFRQLLIESLLLSMAGALIGVLFARWGSRLLVDQLSTWAFAATLDLALDWRVVAVSTVATGFTTVLCGTAPAIRALRVGAMDALRPQSGPGRGRPVDAGSALVVGQIALSLVLVIGAGLFLRSFAALAYRDLGFDREPLLVAVVDVRDSAAPPSSRLALLDQLRTAVAAIPGVDAAAISMATPLGSTGVRMTPAITVPGRAMPAEGVRILTNPVTPDWFRTFGTRLLAGRDFDLRDDAAAPPVVIANEAFARRYLAGVSPVGQTIVEHDGVGNAKALEIVGLVEDAAFVSVRESIAPALYAPFAQRVDAELLAGFPSVSLSVRAAGGNPMALSGSVTAAISERDRDLRVSFQTVAEQLEVFYVRERLLAMLSGFFGGFAMLLAALGLYASLSYAVTRRRREIGIRMALGAEPGAVLRLVLRRVITLTSAGILIGAIGSYWLAQLVGALLYEIPARDAITFWWGSAILVGVAMLAGLIPARRAARIDPAIALRDN